MEIEVREMHDSSKYPWAIVFKNGEGGSIGARAKTREAAERAAKKARRMTACNRCGKWAAGGGQRFCRPCLLIVLEESKTSRPPQQENPPAGKPYPINHRKPWIQNGHSEEIA